METGFGASCARATENSADVVSTAMNIRNVFMI